MIKSDSLLGQQPATAEVFACDALGQQFVPALSYADIASGLLTTALSRDMRNCIIWLRREKPRTVKWAGNYQSGLTQNAAGIFRLTPRKSFDIWCETWRGRSDPWSQADTGIAAMLSLSVPEVLNQKHTLEAEQVRIRRAHLVSEGIVQQFNKLTGAVPGVVYQFLVTPGGNWTFLYLSAYVRELFEVSPEDAYRDHNVMTSCVVEEHREAHRASVLHAYRTLTPWIHEHLIQTHSGVRKWVRGQALPEEQADGSVLWHGILTNITADKQAQEKLRQSEERWKFALQGSGDGVWDWNIQTGEALYSRRWEEMLGFAENEIGNFSYEWSNRVHPEDMPGVMKIFQAHIDGETASAEFEFRMMCKAGSWLWILGRGKVISRSSDGRPLRLVGTNTDITERKRAEDALRLAASVFAHAREGILVTDVQGSILDINAAFSRITGYSRTDVLGQNPRILQSGIQDKAFYIAMWNDLTGQGYWEGEIWNQRKNGEVYPEKLAITVVRDAQGNAQQYVAMFSDIGEHKRIELELIESEKKFRLIAENTSDGITIFDKHGHIQYVSPSVNKQLGYSEQEELGRSSADVYALLDPQGRDALFQTLNEAIQNKALALTYSYRVRHKAGHYIWREDNSNFRYTSAGEYDGAYVVSRDITERKRMEEEVRQLAFFDPLTKLPNRRMLKDRLSQTMAASKRSGRYGAVMILDLDNFKPLNDHHGHLVGDLLLVEVAQRLIDCVRGVDTVARFGGDEFVVVLGELDGHQRKVAQNYAATTSVNTSNTENYLVQQWLNDFVPVTCWCHLRNFTMVANWTRIKLNPEGWPR